MIFLKSLTILSIETIDLSYATDHFNHWSHCQYEPLTIHKSLTGLTITLSCIENTMPKEKSIPQSIYKE